MATLLQELVGADEWDSEDMVGRLGLLMHAAFLAVGFHPYGAKPDSGHLLTATSAGEAAGSSRRLSRYYTVPELAHRDGADAAVLLVCARGDDVALLAFLTKGGGLYLERLDLPLLLSRALREAEPWASRICWALAGGVCWGLRVQLCRRNRLPLTDLMSLPDDMKMEILKRLGDGKALARVVCTCAQLRELVAERDAELWKPLYEALMSPRRTRGWLYHLWFLLDSSDDDDDSEAGEEVVFSWKRKYVQARPPPSSPEIGRRWPTYTFWDMHIRLNWPSIRLPSWDTDSHLGRLEDPLEEEEEDKVSTRPVGAGVHRRKGPRNDFKKKRHHAGAIHSPSSRYRWKHR
ncbi:hypothetical protein EJB05_47192, partial [Eragrostis curvula]